MAKSCECCDRGAGLPGFGFFYGHRLNGAAAHDQIAVRFCNLRHLQSESVAPPGHRNDVFRVVGLIAQGFPKLKDVLAEIGLLNKGVRPQDLHQVVLQNDPFAVLHEHQKRFEGLRRQGNRFLIAH